MSDKETAIRSERTDSGRERSLPHVIGSLFPWTTPFPWTRIKRTASGRTGTPTRKVRRNDRKPSRFSRKKAKARARMQKRSRQRNRMNRRNRRRKV